MKCRKCTLMRIVAMLLALAMCLGTMSGAVAATGLDGSATETAGTEAGTDGSTTDVDMTGLDASGAVDGSAGELGADASGTGGIGADVSEADASGTGDAGDAEEPGTDASGTGDADGADMSETDASSSGDVDGANVDQFGTDEGPAPDDGDGQVEASDSVEVDLGSGSMIDLELDTRRAVVADTAEYAGSGRYEHAAVIRALDDVLLAGIDIIVTASGPVGGISAWHESGQISMADAVHVQDICLFCQGADGCPVQAEPSFQEADGVPQITYHVGLDEPVPLSADEDAILTYAVQLDPELVRSFEESGDMADPFAVEVRAYLGDGSFASSEASMPDGGLFSIDQAVAHNESTGAAYATLTDAVNKASSGDILTLLQDISENVTVGTKFAGASLEIDLGGHAWTGAAGGSALFVSKAGLELTVRNGLMGSAGSSMINVGNAKSMRVSDVTFEGYMGTGDVAKCANSSVMDFVFERCSFQGNMVTGSSHYVVSSKGSLSLVDCLFEGNTSADAVIYATGGSFTLLGTDPANPARLDRNTGKYVIYCKSPSVEVSNVHAEGNASSGDGSMNSESGGVGYFAPLKAGSVKLSNVTASGNKSGGYGGAFVLYSNYDVEFLMDGCDIHGNTSQKQGGGVYLRTGMGKILTAAITDTAIHGNKAYLSVLAARDAIGGGLYIDSVSVNRSTTTSAVTLGAGTRIYGNNVPDGDETLEPYGADIGLASGIAFTQYKSSKPSKDKFDGKQASLVFGDGYMFNVTDGNVEYRLSAEPQVNGKYPIQNGTDKSSPKYKWYWPAGYSSEAVEPVEIYLCGDGDHAGEANVITVRTLQDAINAAKDNGRDTVYVCREVGLVAADADLLNKSGVTFRRCPEHPGGYMFAAGSDFVLDGAHIDGNNIEGDSALVHVTGGTLTIKGGTVIENGWNNAQSGEGSKGRGGGIRLDGGTLDMSGGTVRNCVARAAGGGIYGHYANMYFDGGEVSGNKAGDGAGAYVFGTDGTEARFGTRGGRTVFSQNAATAQGGGVALNGGSHEIAMATFTRNSAMYNLYYSGGAIYIQTNTEVHMSNVFISGNWSDKDGAETGAIACCPTGELIIYGRDGLMSQSSSGEFDIRVSPFDANPHGEPEDPLVHLPMTALGGAVPTYLNDRGTAVDASMFQYANVRDMALNMSFPEGSTAAENARAVAEASGVVITENRAYQMGSAIMTNGTLVIGTETKAVRVTKSWADGDDNHAGDKVLVYLTRDGEPVAPESRSDAAVTLDASNGWSHMWGDLDPDGAWSFEEAAFPGYSPSLGEEMKADARFTAVPADMLYERELVNTPEEGDTCSLTITNAVEGMDPDRSFGFTLELSDAGDKPLALELGGKLLPIVKGKISFRLKHGESAKVRGLPKGFGYKITEETGDDYTSEYDEDRNGDDVTASFVNRTFSPVKLPSTGGSGTGWFVWLGACCCLTGLVLIGKKKRHSLC